MRSWILEDGPVDRLAGKVAEALDARIGPVRATRRTFLDTFDWRLWRAGEELVADGAELRWSRSGDGQVLLQVPVERLPRRAGDLPGARSRVALAERIEDRALLPRVEVGGEAVPLEVRDPEGKVVLRGEVLRLQVPSEQCRIVLERVRGYPDAADRAEVALRSVRATPAPRTVLEEALLTLGRRAGDYSARVEVRMSPETPADRAARAVLRELLAVVVANAPGVREDLDPEFLHDLRVAVRRARSVLGQLRAVLPSEARLREPLRWLGATTGPVRDLDVLASELPTLLGAADPAAAGLDGAAAPTPRVAVLRTFRASGAAPGPARGDRLEPLLELIHQQRVQARAELVRVLDAPRFTALLRDWWTTLDVDAADGPPVGTVVGERVAALARRVRRDGRAIGPHASGEALHELRKTCKKLRYLVELFGPAFAPERVARCVAALKPLQAELGAVQDREVQLGRLAGWVEELSDRPEGAESLVALGVLRDRLRQQQRTERAGLALADRVELVHRLALELAGR